jgi:hypothetical protein
MAAWLCRRWTGATLSELGPMPLGRIEARLLCGMNEVTTWKRKGLVEFLFSK